MPKTQDPIGWYEVEGKLSMMMVLAASNALFFFIALGFTLILLELCCVLDNHGSYSVGACRQTVHSPLLYCLCCTDMYLQFVLGYLSAI